MAKKGIETLSRRERQIMDVLYAHGEASAADIRARLEDPPSYSAVRAMLRVLRDKGYVKHHQDGPRYVYRPTVSPSRASESALKRVLDTFFAGSTEQAVAALLDLKATGLSEEEFQRLQDLIEQSRKEGR